MERQDPFVKPTLSKYAPIYEPNYSLVKKRSDLRVMRFEREISREGINRKQKKSARNLLSHFLSTKAFELQKKIDNEPK